MHTTQPREIQPLAPRRICARALPELGSRGTPVQDGRKGSSRTTGLQHMYRPIVDYDIELLLQYSCSCRTGTSAPERLARELLVAAALRQGLGQMPVWQRCVLRRVSALHQRRRMTLAVRRWQSTLEAAEFIVPPVGANKGWLRPRARVLGDQGGSNDQMVAPRDNNSLEISTTILQRMGSRSRPPLRSRPAVGHQAAPPWPPARPSPCSH